MAAKIEEFAVKRIDERQEKPEFKIEGLETERKGRLRFFAR